MLNTFCVCCGFCASSGLASAASWTCERKWRFTWNCAAGVVAAAPAKQHAAALLGPCCCCRC